MKTRFVLFLVAFLFATSFARAAATPYGTQAVRIRTVRHVAYADLKPGMIVLRDRVAFVTPHLLAYKYLWWWATKPNTTSRLDPGYMGESTYLGVVDP